MLPSVRPLGASARRQNIWSNLQLKLAERGPCLEVDLSRLAWGVASADVEWPERQTLSVICAFRIVHVKPGHGPDLAVRLNALVRPDQGTRSAPANHRILQHNPLSFGHSEIGCQRPKADQAKR